MKRIISLIAVVGLLVATLMVLAVPAFAQGQIERGPEHAKSICSFSGLNDEFGIPGPEGTRTQSYGQLVRQGVAEPSARGDERPGILCNPNNLPLK